MDPRTERLMDWVAGLATFAEKGEKLSVEGFKDGVLLGRILREDIDSEYFHDLKDWPLVKVIDKMKKYLAQVDLQMPTHLLPNAGKIISTGDMKEIGRLLQLLLNCAVNCPRKEYFVNAIRERDESVQLAIKGAIEEVMKVEKEDKGFFPEVESYPPGRIFELQNRVEVLSQRNHELKGEVTHLKEERIALASENERLNSQLNSHLNDPESIHMTMKFQDESKKEVERLREENYKLEDQVVNSKQQITDLQKQIADVHSKMASTANAAEELRVIKDELDFLREAAAKANQHEGTIRSYKKKLEEMTFLKRSIKELEEKNEELHKANINLEDEMKKTGGLKSQTDALKKELAEIQRRLSDETSRALKAEFDCKNLKERLETASQAATGMEEEKNRLREELDELRMNSEEREESLSNIADGNGVDSIELLPQGIRQRIIRLELEKKKLNEKLDASIESGSAGEGSKVLVEQLRKHEAELDEQLLVKTQEFTEYQNSTEEKIRRLEALVLEKEEELKKNKNRYEKCIEKAKSVVVALEPTASAGLDLAKSDPDKERASAIREREEKLMASVYYNLSLQLHKNSVEARNQTFLQRHRHPAAPRKKSEM